MRPMPSVLRIVIPWIWPYLYVVSVPGLRLLFGYSMVTEWWSVLFVPSFCYQTLPLHCSSSKRVFVIFCGNLLKVVLVRFFIYFLLCDHWFLFFVHLKVENWESQHHSVTVELPFLVNVKIPCGWLCAERTRLHLNTLWMHHLFVWTCWDCSPNTYCLFHHGRPKLAPAQCTYLLIFVQICCSYLFVWKLLYKLDLCRVPGAYSASRPLWTSKEFILK
jgi:hypothetical protein